MKTEPIVDYSKCLQIANQCTCMHVRKASRAITQYFDRTMVDAQLSNSQFTMLVALALMGTPALTQIADALGMDRTTLSRNLKPLLENGLVENVESSDKRTKLIAISTKGKSALARAIPLWEKAQQGFVQRMGQGDWKELVKKLSASVVVASSL